MSRLRVAPIVEGYGEVESLRTLLQRVWYEILGGAFIGVIQPIRQPRGRLVQKGGLQKAVQLALMKLKLLPASPDPAMVLILIDADEDCPAKLGPTLLDYGREVAQDADLACILAKGEYETWFAAAAESLDKYLEFPPEFRPSEDPEGARQGKAWVEGYFRGVKYSETQDQPGMTSAMDTALCRRRSPSFDKLCRELERRLRRQGPSA